MLWSSQPLERNAIRDILLRYFRRQIKQICRVLSQTPRVLSSTSVGFGRERCHFVSICWLSESACVPFTRRTAASIFFPVVLLLCKASIPPLTTCKWSQLFTLLGPSLTWKKKRSEGSTPEENVCRTYLEISGTITSLWIGVFNFTLTFHREIFCQD